MPAFTRHRENDDRQNLVITKEAGTTGNLTTSTVERWWEGSFEYTDDVEIENFHARKAKGELFFNPYSHYESRRSVSCNGFAYGQTDANGYTSSADGPIWLWGGDLAMVHHRRQVNISRLESLAITEAFAGVREPEFQGLVALGELRETVQLLRNPIAAFTKYMRRPKVWRAARKQYRKEQSWLKRLKGMSSTARRAMRNPELEALSGAWLSGRYGVRPLISDIQGVMSAIDALKEKSRPLYTSRGHSQQTATESWSETGGLTARQTWSPVCTTEDFVDCRAGVTYECDTRDTWGMSLSQIPVALWETTFCSFMVDWAVNIGDYLAALTPKAGIRVKGSWVRTEHLMDTKRVVSCVWTPSVAKDYLIMPGDGVEDYSSIARWRKVNVRPRLAVKPAFLNWDLGTARYVDALLIARQFIK